MDSQSVIVFDEINQLIEQYKAEVPGRRRAWPVSIKSRVLELCAVEGVTYNDVAARTGIPYHTLLTWRFQNKKRESVAGFKAVAVTTGVKPQALAVTAAQAAPFGRVVRGEAAPGPTVTVKKRRSRLKSSQTLTVTVGNGVRVEGLDLSSAMKIIERFGHGNQV